MKPELSVASAGARTTYGHPSEEVAKVLEDSRSVFLCTIQKGDVHVMPGSHGVMVQGSLG